MNSVLNNPKVVIVMPAYNAERTVRDTYKEIPVKLRKHIILVDDGSRDNTVSLACSLGIKVFEHPNNLGYGGNQKTCYWEALKLNPDVVVMLHPDYQYDATMIEDLIAPIVKGKYDFMFGSRIANKKSALIGGMPLLKYYVNRLVCFIQNILLGVNFTEHFSGFRAYSAKLLKTVPFQRFSNDFVFDQEMTISSIGYGMRIGEISIPTRYHDKASSIKFLRGTKFVLEGFYTIFRFYLSNWGLVKDPRFKAASGFLGTKLLALAAIFVMSIPVYFSLGFIYTLLATTIGMGMYFLFSKKDSSKFILAAVFISLSLLLVGNVDKGRFFTRSGEEEHQKIRNHQYFTREFGKFYRNRIGFFYFDEFKFYLDEARLRISRPLAIERYFFATSPSLYSILLLPVFLVGVVTFVGKKVSLIFFYLLSAAVVSIFIDQSRSYLLYLPFINLCIVLGGINIVNKIR